MIIDPYWLIILVGVAWLFGFELGKRSEARHWRLKSDDTYGNRTANCSAGKFYYVIPEKEYVEKILELR